MKRTLKEEQERINELLKLLDDPKPESTSSELDEPIDSDVNAVKDEPSDKNESIGLSILGGRLNMAIEHIKAVRDSIASGDSDDEFRELITMATDAVLSGKKTGDDEDIDGPPPVAQETDEYNKTYNKNMTQGFAINESNAFIGAAIKAKNEGKDKFQVNGKTYKVTLKKK